MRGAGWRRLKASCSVVGHLIKSLVLTATHNKLLDTPCGASDRKEKGRGGRRGRGWSKVGHREARPGPSRNSVFGIVET